MKIIIYLIKISVKIVWIKIKILKLIIIQQIKKKIFKIIIKHKISLIMKINKIIYVIMKI
jgi:hypothetical protein